MSNNLYEWVHDDITWCGNECSYVECERNMQNRLTKGGLFSAAMFKGTETCPLTGNTSDRENGVKKMDEIETCPFCGFEGEAVEEWVSHGLHEGGYTWLVRCNYLKGGCGAKGGGRDTKEEAIETWNRRAKGNG